MALFLVSCGGDGPPPTPVVEGPLHIVANPESTNIVPGQSREVVFQLLSEKNAGVPERVIQFSILDDPATPEDEARGATLSADRGTTNGEGSVTLQIIAGPRSTVFRIRASAPRASDLEVVVFVKSATFAPAELVPVMLDAPITAEQEITTVRLHLLEGGACAGVRYESLPKSSYPVRTIPSDTTALYSSVDTERNHAAVGIGLDMGGVARAGGCVDLPGALLVPDTAVRVVLPLHVFRVSPEGRFSAISHLQFPRPGARAAGIIADAWGELSVCPMDPARLWLDCTIDALKSDGDPSDCRPTENEGPLALKINIRRGVPLPAPGMGRCRDRVDSAGRMSLEPLVEALFPRTKPPLVTALPALGAEAKQILEAIRIHSVLLVDRTSQRDRYQISHRLVAAEFPFTAERTVVDLATIGLPVIEARFVAGAMTARNDLEVSNHSFTLRLGSAARLAFARASLQPRGVAGDLSAFVPALFGLAGADGTVAAGCNALDALVCSDVGVARGCLGAACADGLAALGRRLNDGFAAIDGDDLDLVLGGSVPALDADGDRRADALGMLNVPASPPGIWSGEVRGRGGTSALTGIWTAVRE
jgi:hypothetical protein